MEKILLALTSMIVCIGLILSGVLDVKTAFLGFINSNVILFVAILIPSVIGIATTSGFFAQDYSCH